MRRILSEQFSRRVFSVFFRETSSPQIELFDDNAPIVCLMGWLGCKQKWFDHYVSMYDELGVSTVSTIPAFFAGLRKKHLSDHGLSILETLKEIENVEKRSIFIHTFSGMGMYLYHDFLSHLENDKSSNFMKKSLKGEIFDSPIMRPDKNTTVRGFVGAATGGICTNMSYNHKLFEIIFGTVYSLLLLYPKFRNMEYDFQENLVRFSTSDFLKNKPMLMIYSKNDGVVTFEDSSEFICLQTSIGRDISAIDFGGSLHCTHLKTYPDKYKSEIFEFVTSHC